MPPTELDDKTKTQPARDVDGVAERRSMLVVSRGSTQTFELPVCGRLIVGRGDDCDVCVAHPSVSRRHAAFDIDAHGVRVEDLDSANGTRVGGRQLRRGKQVIVPRGTLVEIGSVSVLVQTEGVFPYEAHQSIAACREPESTMGRIEQLVEAVAKSRISVVLLGETGVGKEVMARKIHELSPRSHMPLVTINCAAMPEALLESELFGHERGAFTGATHAKQGQLSAADGSTVFFDEVGELPLSTQAKLLRVLETREVLPIGSLKSHVVDVRFVAATNRDLDTLVAKSLFRADLFYRLNGIAIAIPPLRDRRREIPSLAYDLVARLCQQEGARAAPAISERAMDLLRRAAWPGNVRELRNVIERALVLCGKGPIDPAHLPPTIRTPTPNRGEETSDLKADLDAIERARIIEALEREGGNQSRTADALGISRRTLVSRIAAYGLPRPRKRR